MGYYDKDQILASTNGGLDILLWIYPDAAETVGKANRKFKVRSNEKTPSATLKKLSDGNWVVTDFGGGAKSMNGIQAYVEEKQVDFATACQRIAEQFNIPATDGTMAKPVNAKVDGRKATEDEKEGEWAFDLRPEFTPFELETIFAKYIRKACADERLIETLKSTVVRP